MQASVCGLASAYFHQSISACSVTVWKSDISTTKVHCLWLVGDTGQKGKHLGLSNTGTEALLAAYSM